MYIPRKQVPTFQQNQMAVLLPSQNMFQHPTFLPITFQHFHQNNVSTNHISVLPPKQHFYQSHFSTSTKTDSVFPPEQIQHFLQNRFQNFQEYKMKEKNDLHSFPRSESQINQNGDNARRIFKKCTFFFQDLCLRGFSIPPPVWE